MNYETKMWDESYFLPYLTRHFIKFKSVKGFNIKMKIGIANFVMVCITLKFTAFYPQLYIAELILRDSECEFTLYGSFPVM